MDLNKEQLEEIDNYWQNELSESQKNNFENKLKEDNSLATTFRKVQSLRLGIQYHHLQKKLTEFKEIERQYKKVNNVEESALDSKLKAATRLNKNEQLLHQFEDFETEIAINQKTEKTKSIPEKKIPWKIAAGLLFLIFAGWLLVQQIPTTNPQELATTLFDTYPHQYSIRDTESTSIKTAFNLYDFGKYEEAIPLMEKIASTEQKAIFNFHLGIAYLGNNEIDRAIELFIKIKADLPNMEEQINWYLGLAYLRKGDTTKAKTYFTKVNNYKKETVKHVLEQLD